MQTTQPTPQEVNDSLALILEIFKQFRPIILARAGKTAFTTKTGDGSPVTETDVEIEKALQAKLAEKFPSIPVFGEESGYDDAKLPPACWLVDPLDGTKSFIANQPTFTCMAVFIQNKEATAAIIYNPSTQDVFTAQKGEGAFKNGVRLDLTAIPLPKVAFCKSIFFEEINAMLAPKSVSCQEPPAGGGHGFTMVADGQAAARFNLHGGGYTHDYAPGGLLIREAGGALLPILNDTYSFTDNCFVACHPELAETIRPHLARLRELEMTRTT